MPTTTREPIFHYFHYSIYDSNPYSGGTAIATHDGNQMEAYSKAGAIEEIGIIIKRLTHDRTVWALVWDWRGVVIARCVANSSCTRISDQP